MLMSAYSYRLISARGCHASETAVNHGIVKIRHMFSNEMSISFSSVLYQVVRLFDIFLVLAAGVLAYYWRFGDVELTSSYLIALVIAGFAVSAIFPMAGVYRSWRGQRLLGVATGLLGAWGITLLVLLVISVLIKTNTIFSRQWFAYWALLAWFLLLLFRLTLYRFLRLMR